MDARTIIAMGDFAATTENNVLSVQVSRIVQKLHNRGKQFEDHYTQITPAEQRIIALFQRHVQQT